ncbi:MAG TPA: zinc ribbon domain-containing protein [Gemmatimonadales bacterium]
MAHAAATPVAPAPSTLHPHRAHACRDCRYCGSALPRGRAVSFCPYCGQDLTVRQCPACSAELDLGWRFCVCCGRGVEGG